MTTDSRKPDIRERFSTRAQAERYRDRFKQGRHRRTHDREVRALNAVLASLQNVRTVLDVGSGPGRFVPQLAAEGRYLVQADTAWNMLMISREGYPLARGAHVQASILGLPMREACADLVFCHRLLNHLPDTAQRMQALRELARAASRYVVVSCLNAPQWVKTLRSLIGRKTETTVTPEMLMENAPHAGLEIVAQQPIRGGLATGAFIIFKKAAPTGKQPAKR